MAGLTVVLIQLVITLGEHYMASSAYNKLYIERGVSSQAVFVQGILTVAVFLVLSLPSFATLAVALRSMPIEGLLILFLVMSFAFSVALWLAFICRSMVYIFGESVISTLAISLFSIAIPVLLVGFGLTVSSVFRFSLYTTFRVSSLICIGLLLPACILNAALKMGSR